MKLVLGTEVGLSPGDFVLEGDPVLFPERGRSPPPPFSTHFYCGQTAACIKIPLGMELGLGPGDFVLDGDPAPLPKRGAEPPNFRPTFIAAKRLDEAGTWHKGRPQSSNFVLDGDPVPFRQKGAEPLPNFQPISIVAKRLHASKYHLGWC